MKKMRENQQKKSLLEREIRAAEAYEKIFEGFIKTCHFSRISEIFKNCLFDLRNAKTFIYDEFENR